MDNEKSVECEFKAQVAILSSQLLTSRVARLSITKLNRIDHFALESK